MELSGVIHFPKWSRRLWSNEHAHRVQSKRNIFCFFLNVLIRALTDQAPLPLRARLCGSTTIRRFVWRCSSRPPAVAAGRDDNTRWSRAACIAIVVMGLQYKTGTYLERIGGYWHTPERLRLCARRRFVGTGRSGGMNAIFGSKTYINAAAAAAVTARREREREREAMCVCVWARMYVNFL